MKFENYGVKIQKWIFDPLEAILGAKNSIFQEISRNSTRKWYSSGGVNPIIFAENPLRSRNFSIFWNFSKFSKKKLWGFSKWKPHNFRFSFGKIPIFAIFCKFFGNYGVFWPFFQMKSTFANEIWKLWGENLKSIFRPFPGVFRGSKQHISRDLAKPSQNPRKKWGVNPIILGGKSTFSSEIFDFLKIFKNFQKKFSISKSKLWGFSKWKPHNFDFHLQKTSIPL